MGPIQVVVTDANNLVLEVTPTPNTTVILDRGIAGPPGPTGTGDVDGPASATDNAVARFDGTTGKLIQNSVVTISDTGNMAGVGTLAVTDLTDSSLTSGRVTYAGTGGNLVDSANLTFDGTNLTLGGGTANGVAYLNGSKVLTTGSALTFDSSDRLIVGAASAAIGQRLEVVGNTSGGAIGIRGRASDATGVLSWHANAAATEYARIQSDNTSSLIFGLGASGSEQMRLTSTGLKVGTTSDFSGAKVVTDGGGIGILNKGLLRSSTNGVLQVSADPNNAYASSQISFDVDGSTVATLDSSGNLGIGTSSPSRSLTIERSGAAFPSASNPSVRLNETSSGRFAVMELDSSQNLNFWNGDAGFGSTRFYRGSGSGTLSMTIDGSGNLGLGVTPSSTIWSGDETRLVVKGNGSSKAGVLGLQSQGTTNATTAFFVAEDLRAGASLGTSTNSFLAFQTNGIERARITSGGTFSTSLDALIYGITVGRGAGAVSTNTAVGASALAANTTGTATAIGQSALQANTTGLQVTGIGQAALTSNTTGANNTALGYASALLNTTGSNNTALGSTALFNNTTASNNTAVGYQALFLNTTASNNTAVGFQAGYNNTTGVFNAYVGTYTGYYNQAGNGNTALGYGAFSSNGSVVSASNNTALGHLALSYNTTGTYNTAVGGTDVTGYSPLNVNTTGSSNTAVGNGALARNTTASNNTAVGYQAGYSNVTGVELTALGFRAAYSNTGSYTTAIGYTALYSNTSGVENTAVGDATGYSNTTGYNNTAIGSIAFYANTTGQDNSVVGRAALRLNTTGSYITAVGASALYSNTTASNNTAVGYQSMYSNTTGAGTAVGFQSLYANTTGQGNAALGWSALGSNTTGNGNTAVGQAVLGVYNGALFANTTGSNNTAIGSGALIQNTTASNNTAVGYQAGYSNTTGGENTILGHTALRQNTTGNSAVALGYAALFNNTTGVANVAVGLQALVQSTTASFNTAVGYQAGFSNTAGARNTFLGYQAGYTSNGTGNAGNTAVGAFSGFSLTTGTNNTFIGSGGGCGYFVTTGSNNTIIGAYTGNGGGLDIRTASNYIVLSDGDGNPRASCTTAGAWYFYNTGGAGSDVVNAYSGAAAGTGRSLYTGWYGATSPTAGTLSFNVTTNGNVTNTNNSYGAISDIKLKENIVDATPKLEKLCQVRVVNYNFKKGQTHKQIGVIAQELEQVFPSMVEEAPDTDIDGNDLGTTTKQVKYSVFVPMLIKAMQELKSELDSVKAELATLKGA